MSEPTKLTIEEELKISRLEIDSLKRHIETQNKVEMTRIKECNYYRNEVNKLADQLAQQNNSYDSLDESLCKYEKQIDSLNKKLALAEQGKDQVSKNYTRICNTIDESVDMLWDMYDSVIKGQKIEKEDIRHLLFTLLQN